MAWGKAGKKALDATVTAVIREVVREEIQTELQRILNPTFLELVTRGQAEMEKIFDAVIDFERELDEVKTSLQILQRLLEQRVLGPSTP